MQTTKFSIFTTDSEKNLEIEKNLTFKGNFNAFSPKEAVDSFLEEFKISEESYITAFWKIGDINLYKKFIVYPKISITYVIEENKTMKETPAQKKESLSDAKELYIFYVYQLGMPEVDALAAARTICKDFSPDK